MLPVPRFGSGTCTLNRHQVSLPTRGTVVFWRRLFSQRRRAQQVCLHRPIKFPTTTKFLQTHRLFPLNCKQSLSIACVLGFRNQHLGAEGYRHRWGGCIKPKRVRTTPASTPGRQRRATYVTKLRPSSRQHSQLFLVVLHGSCEKAGGGQRHRAPHNSQLKDGTR